MLDNPPYCKYVHPDRVKTAPCDNRSAPDRSGGNIVSSVITLPTPSAGYLPGLRRDIPEGLRCFLESIVVKCGQKQEGGKEVVVLFPNFSRTPPRTPERKSLIEQSLPDGSERVIVMLDNG